MVLRIVTSEVIPFPFKTLRLTREYKARETTRPYTPRLCGRSLNQPRRGCVWYPGGAEMTPPSRQGSWYGNYLPRQNDEHYCPTLCIWQATPDSTTSSVVSTPGKWTRTRARRPCDACWLNRRAQVAESSPSPFLCRVSTARDPSAVTVETTREVNR